MRISALKSILKDRLDRESVFQLESNFTFLKTKEALGLVEVLNLAQANKSKANILIYSSTDKEQIRGFLNTEIKMINVANLKITKLASAKNFVFTPSARELLETRLSAK